MLWWHRLPTISCLICCVQQVYIATYMCCYYCRLFNTLPYSLRICVWPAFSLNWILSDGVLDQHPKISAAPSLHELVQHLLQGWHICCLADMQPAGLPQHHQECQWGVKATPKNKLGRQMYAYVKQLHDSKNVPDVLTSGCALQGVCVRCRHFWMIIAMLKMWPLAWK